MVWDDIEYNNSNIFAVGSMGFPGWFTIDMGQDVLLSRMQLFQRLLLPYCNCWARNFEIWGSHAPDDEGRWDRWLLFGKFEFKKPSGLPGFELPNEVMESSRKYSTFEFHQGIP